MEATVVITTRNRKEELRVALASCQRQSLSHEVLVIDDGSTDGTEQMVRSEFPNVRLVTSDKSFGYIVQRNRAAAMARGRVIFSIDDDAEFSDPVILERTVEDLDADSRIGAVAIPCIEPNKNGRQLQMPPDQSHVWIVDRFIGTSHALRRDLFVALGGYRETLIHQGEESDYCIRMLDSGFLVRLGNSPPIIHYESPKREYSRMDFYGRRNDILFHWHNTPMPDLLWRLPSTVAGGLLCAARVRRLKHMIRGVTTGCMEVAKGCERRPVSRETARVFMRLRRSGGIRLVG